MNCTNLTARIGLDPYRPDCADLGLGLLAAFFLVIFLFACCSVCDNPRCAKHSYGRV
jgi:hypothetical protein